MTDSNMVVGVDDGFRYSFHGYQHTMDLPCCTSRVNLTPIQLTTRWVYLTPSTAVHPSAANMVSGSQIGIPVGIAYVGGFIYVRCKGIDDEDT